MKKLLLLLLSLFFVLVFYIWWQIPSEAEIKGCIITSLYQVNLCPQSKEYVPLGGISSYMQKSIIMSEDASFYTHNGFDWDELENSFIENLKKGKFKRGGSTITQQLAKNMFLSKDKSLLRKGIEALITYKIEKTLKKREILERYLNVIEFGKGIFGIKAASQFYFKKSPAALNLLESTFLTMLLPNPIKYSSSFYKKQLTPYARKRMAAICLKLYKTGKISVDEYEQARLTLDSFLQNRPLDEYIEKLQSQEQDQENFEPDPDPEEF